jgi:predicted nucleic acid-binding protein
MTVNACLDTGVFSIFFSKECTTKVSSVMQQLKKGSLHAQVVSPVVSEILYHACTVEGKERAQALVNSLLEDYNIDVISPDRVLLFSAGVLRCQHRNALSYIDCMSIAYVLKMGIPFHTTEKKLKQIPGNILQRLKVVKYELP